MLSVISHLRHCLEKKTRNFTRLCQCSKQCCETHHAHEDISLCSSKRSSKMKTVVFEENAQQKESFFPSGVVQRAFCSAADQLSSFRLASVADRISIQVGINYTCFFSKPTDPRSAMSCMRNPVRSLWGKGWSSKSRVKTLSWCREIDR